MPKDMESYYQEAGRRPGRVRPPAASVYGGQDAAPAEFLITHSDSGRSWICNCGCGSGISAYCRTRRARLRQANPSYPFRRVRPGLLRELYTCFTTLREPTREARIILVRGGARRALRRGGPGRDPLRRRHGEGPEIPHGPAAQATPSSGERSLAARFALLTRDLPALPRPVSGGPAGPQRRRRRPGRSSAAHAGRSGRRPPLPASVPHRADGCSRSFPAGSLGPRGPPWPGGRAFRPMWSSPTRPCGSWR